MSCGQTRPNATVGFCLAILLLGAPPGHCAKNSDVLKSAEVDAMLANTQHSLSIVAQPNYSVALQVNSGPSGSPKKDPVADEIWSVRRGTAKLLLGDLSQRKRAASSDQQYKVGAGDIVNIPRNKAYQIIPGTARFEYVVIRIFPSERHLPRIGSGSGPEPHPMPTVAPKSVIDARFARADKNEILYSAGAVLISYIVAPPSWPKPSLPEAHMTCDDFYFIRLGTARIAIGGTIVNPKEQPAGEIHGTSAIGAREYALGPGDLVSIPRHTMHDLAPESARFGYLLVKICD